MGFLALSSDSGICCLFLFGHDSICQNSHRGNEGQRLHQLKDGSLVFVFSFDQSAVGGMQYVSRGGRDILLVRVSPKGDLYMGTHIGGPGSDSYFQILQLLMAALSYWERLKVI